MFLDAAIFRKLVSIHAISAPVHELNARANSAKTRALLVMDLHASCAKIKSRLIELHSRCGNINICNNMNCINKSGNN